MKHRMTNTPTRAWRTWSLKGTLMIALLASLSGWAHADEALLRKNLAERLPAQAKIDAAKAFMEKQRTDTDASEGAGVVVPQPQLPQYPSPDPGRLYSENQTRYRSKQFGHLAPPHYPIRTFQCLLIACDSIFYRSIPA